MLTRSKSNVGTQDSNQKHSTVPRDDVVEVGEMVRDDTMDHDGGTSGGFDDYGQRMDYLHVAWLLREKLNELVDGDKGEFLELALRSLLDMAASRNIVSVDPKMLNHVLWRTLPKELVILVLARLPVPDITRLRCLSKEWRREMATVNSEINQACDEASPSMLTLLLQTSSISFSVTIFDFTKCKWQYAYDLHLRNPRNDGLEQWTVMDACDGGLVCCVSLKWNPTKLNRLYIVVVNLLTQVQHELPPMNYLYSALPTMVKIKVDPHTKCYQVVVVGYTSSDLTFIEIYDSSSEKWCTTMPPCGSIFGRVYNWDHIDGWYDKFLIRIPGAYDFAKRKLEVYSENNPCRRKFVIASVLEKNCMFVLQEHTQMDESRQRRVHQGYSITEYHFENQTKAWMQGKSYECPSFQELTVNEAYCYLILTACDGFVMVYHDCRNQYYWLLDLSTSKWRFPNLPKSPKSLKDFECSTRSLMSRASWNVIP